jgi:hypothetical protein
MLQSTEHEHRFIEPEALAEFVRRAINRLAPQAHENEKPTFVRCAMQISSRTPEGEPLECRICGYRSLVLFSDPPGDTLCPNCGSFAWIVIQRKEVAVREYLLGQFRLDAPTLTIVVNKILDCESTDALATTLQVGLQDILHPDAIAIWGDAKPGRNEPQWIRLAQAGPNDDDAFAKIVLDQRRLAIRRDRIRDSEQFRCGVPLLKRSSGRLLGAIELLYSQPVGLDSEKTIARVVESLAAVSVAKLG